MVADIFSFSPQADIDAAGNLARFIDRCKTELTIFGADFIWEDWKWPRAAYFTKLGTHSGSNDESTKLDEEFIDFAKAYFRYQQGHKPTKAKNEMIALRAIEADLLQSGHSASASNITISILDNAAQIIREYYCKGAAYHGGRELERLAKFLTSKNLVASNLTGWKNPIQRKNDEIQTGKKAKERRDKKMPSDEVLTAMAEIFANNPTDPKDIFTSSTFAMLMCAPSRISEILELPVDCEVEEKDSRGIVRYGWRFFSGKGYGANIKWIPSEMVSIAKEAISRIKVLTSETRKLAKWIELNPDQFYKHSNLPNCRDDKSLTLIEVCQAMGLVCHSKVAAQSSLHGMNMSTNDGEYSLYKLWQHVQERQPKEFPWLSKEKGIKYSNALFCMQRNLLNSVKGTSPVLLWRPTVNVFNHDLSPRLSLGNDYHKSIFDRYGYKALSGERLKVTSHQVRHLLNTIAQRGGLSQLQIANWSGRAEAKQNRTYNHMSEYEMVTLAEEVDTSLQLFGPSGDVAKHMPVTTQEFNLMEKGAVHVTEFGVCVHDFTMSPCEKYRDCLNCTEQVCIKGEQDKLERIKKRFVEVEQQYLSAKKAMHDGLAGADRWYEYHKNTLGRLKELIAIMEDPNVPEGSQIKLRNQKGFNPFRRAVGYKAGSTALHSKEEAKMLDDMTKILGGGLG